MHARQLLSLASTLANIGRGLARPDIQATGEAAHGYWLANRFRCDAWHQRISHHRSAIERCGTSRRTRLWAEVLPTLEEILTSEPLTRIVAYLAALLEIRAADRDWSALAHSVLGNHVEARLRCLNLMVFGYGFPVEQAVRLNRLRRLMEFTNDSFISSLPALPDIDAYCFEVPLVKNQQKQFRSYPLSESIDRVRLHTLASATERALQVDHKNHAANPRLNASIAESALGMLPADLFDSFGMAQSQLHSSTKHAGSDIEVRTDDIQRPLAEPFDLFVQIHRRHEINKSHRRL